MHHGIDTVEVIAERRDILGQKVGDLDAWNGLPAGIGRPHIEQHKLVALSEQR